MTVINKLCGAAIREKVREKLHSIAAGLQHYGRIYLGTLPLLQYLLLKLSCAAFEMLII